MREVSSENVHDRKYGDSGVFAVMSCVQSKLQRKSEVMHNKRSRAMGAELGEEGLEGTPVGGVVALSPSSTFNPASFTIPDLDG
ncbi:hypothetical protein EYF80_044700 [Liparis tanakae]|uniref:Uncharacterized protein n=1 Tax=Liparis tanakae TaxID=230148 RepID=A0A4Z2FV51_9TELE|nr:hypothetical protein EYF80_044700 [Liparis tanakae]